MIVTCTYIKPNHNSKEKSESELCNRYLESRELVKQQLIQVSHVSAVESH